MRLGTVLRKYRLVQERSVRDMAAEIRIPFATLSRLENGQAECDMRSFVAILKWLLGSEVENGSTNRK